MITKDKTHLLLVPSACVIELIKYYSPDQFAPSIAWEVGGRKREDGREVPKVVEPTSNRNIPHPTLPPIK